MRIKKNLVGTICMHNVPKEEKCLNISKINKFKKKNVYISVSSRVADKEKETHSHILHPTCQHEMVS